MMTEPRTYIYIENGKCYHQQACGPIIGQAYEHDDLNWQPTADWPYEIVDLRTVPPTRTEPRSAKAPKVENEQMQLPLEEK
jgi:hypothetical protein